MTLPPNLALQRTTMLPDKSALDDAAKMLGLTRARLDAHLAPLRRKLAFSHPTEGDPSCQST